MTRIPQIRIQLMREVGEIALFDWSSGAEGATQFLYQFLVIAEVSREMNAVMDDCLRWLIKNKLTGHNFVNWVRYDNGNSPLKAFAVLRKNVRKDLELKEVVSDQSI